VGQTGEFWRELGGEVVGTEIAEFEQRPLQGVGWVVETVGIEGLADESADERAGEIGDGEGVAAGVGLVDDCEGEGVDEAERGICAGGGVIAGVFADDIGNGEVG